MTQLRMKKMSIDHLKSSRGDWSITKIQNAQCFQSNPNPKKTTHLKPKLMAIYVFFLLAK